MSQSPTLPPRRPPPLPFPTPSTLLSHGAEAHLYLTHHLLRNDPSRLSVLKHRPRKPYRHPTLDARLTRHRILSEARILAKLRRDADVDVPALWALDWDKGWLMMEYVRGGTVAERVRAWKTERELKRKRMQTEEMRAGKERDLEGNETGDDEVRALLWRVGQAVGRMHRAGVVHGDLTTGNLMVRDEDRPSAAPAPAPASAPAPSSSPPTTAPSPFAPSATAALKGPITLIDFGLASQSTQDEDRAVDLYVLERALGSSHPGLELCFDDVLMRGYADGLVAAAAGAAGKGTGRKAKSEKGGAGAEGGKTNIGPGKVEVEVEDSAEFKAVRRKLEDVRGRGRKRSMIG
ncbi:MAG: serine/threonine-protein kinase bud32 [Sclerophora amabilis]|nr:MAG: serine/threonine-protein kinase bud32 [Sclerophora amabilis]